MNKLILLFGILICLVAVHARHYNERNADEPSDEQETLRPRDRIPRHRRRRWQSNYGYDYPPPSYYYPDRREDRNSQETIQNIYRLLEDISTYIRRIPPPPPPPQPIYIPYPVIFPTGVNCKAPQNTSDTKNPVPKRRGPSVMEDTNQNWGLVPTMEDYEDENDGSRPISFEPIVPKQLMKRPAPKVEHGTEQVAYSTEAPKFAENPPSTLELSRRTTVPGMCNAAILSCCGFSGDKVKQRQCFANVGCGASYVEGSICTPESIEQSLHFFRVAYSPAQ